jgi:hypothetical protein
MTISDVAPVGAAIVAGLLGAPLWAYITARHQGAQQREIGEIDRLRSEVKEIKASHTACENVVGELKERLAVVEHHHASYLARWVKDAQKRVLWINDKALITIFAPLGFSRADVEGRTFAELLDPFAAAEVDRLDRAALAQHGAAVSSLIKLHPDLPVMHVVKVASVGREGELIYEGHAFRTNDPEIANATGIGRAVEQREISAERLIRHAVEGEEQP